MYLPRNHDLEMREPFCVTALKEACRQLIDDELEPLVLGQIHACFCAMMQCSLVARD